MKNSSQKALWYSLLRNKNPLTGVVRFLLFLILFSVCSLTSSKLLAQNVAPPLDSYVKNEGGTVTIFVALPDTITSSEIEVAIGSKNNNGDLFSHTYTIDQTSGLPTGLTYSRLGTNVFLGAGTITLTDAFNVKIRLKDAGGNWSSYYDYFSN